MTQLPATFVGIVGTNPQYHQISATNGVCKFRLGVSRSRKDDNDNWVNYDQLWIGVECWNQLAENARRSLTKGMLILITGTLITSQWTDENGVKNSRIMLRAEHMGPDLTRYLTNTVSSPRPVVIAAEGADLPNAGSTVRNWIDSSSLAGDMSVVSPEDEPVEKVAAVTQSTAADGEESDGEAPPF